jgi:hypothetical protein
MRARIVAALVVAVFSAAATSARANACPPGGAGAWLVPLGVGTSGFSDGPDLDGLPAAPLGFSDGPDLDARPDSALGFGDGDDLEATPSGPAISR